MVLFTDSRGLCHFHRNVPLGFIRFQLRSIHGMSTLMMSSACDTIYGDVFWQIPGHQGYNLKMIMVKMPFSRIIYITSRLFHFQSHIPLQYIWFSRVHITFHCIYIVFARRRLRPSIPASHHYYWYIVAFIAALPFALRLAITHAFALRFGYQMHRRRSLFDIINNTLAVRWFLYADICAIIIRHGPHIPRAAAHYYFSPLIFSDIIIFHSHGFWYRALADAINRSIMPINFVACLA